MRLAIKYTYGEYEAKDYRHFATGKEEKKKKKLKYSFSRRFLQVGQCVTLRPAAPVFGGFRA